MFVVTGETRARCINPRMCLGCQTGVETSIATPGPFLGLRPSPFLCEKALDALYNFPAA